MNYEQKYKEALEKARQFSEHPLQEDSSSIVEYIFPELADSEDERIRKALIRFHKSTIDVDGIKGEDIIAWLEKQSENEKGERKKDDAYSEFAISAVEDYYSGDNPLRKEIVDWLKSLKQRIKGE